MKSTLAPSVIRRFPLAKQRRMDGLLDKNREGTITAKELSVLKRLVAEVEQLMVANAKKLAAFAERGGDQHPANGVAVTVWVSPATTANPNWFDCLTKTIGDKSCN